MAYFGEHIWVGTTGKLMIYLALITTLLSFISYVLHFVLSAKKQNAIFYQNTGKISFIIHFISLLAASGVLLFALYSNYYEYSYIWSHSVFDLPLAYKLSALWAGKEGSLLFWVLCQSLISLIFLLFSKEKAYKPLLFILPVQAFLVLLVSDLKIFSFQIGESPFLLLREVPSNIGNKIFDMPNYLLLINKGAGLNPLLRNFWMVFHPPVLLAGYAAAVIPWALCMSNLTENENTINKYLQRKYALISLIILGTGLMLGGAWAYVALSFGGFWTWDPVENASLIPFIILLAGLHALPVKKYLSASQNLFIIAYILVFYAAFMTRSGVLGSVSVHSFGEGAAGKFLGILVIVLVSAYFILLIFNILRKRKIAKIKTFEQDIFSKKSFYELTLFLTIAILILSAFHIFFNTSIPLFNFIFKLSLALPPDIIAFYNKWQSLFLILLFILMIFYFVKLQLKSSAKKRINIYILLLSVISIVLIILSTKDIKLYPNLVLLILSLICVIILLSVIIYARVKLHIILIHIGISIFFLGVILAFGNTKKIYNLDAKDNNSNLIKLDKGEKVRTSAGIIKYVGFDVYKDKSFYKINFQKVNSAKNIVFTPVLLHDQMHGDVFEPSVHKTLWGDYFIHTVKTSINPFRPNLNYSKEDTLWLEIGKSIKYNGLNISLLRVETDASGYETDFDNIVLDAVLKVENGINDTLVYASYVVEKGELFHNDAVLEYPELFIRFNTISPDSPSVQLKISEKITDNILIKAEYFPFINFVWLGLLISLLGLLLSFQKKIIKS